MEREKKLAIEDALQPEASCVSAPKPSQRSAAPSSNLPKIINPSLSILFEGSITDRFPQAYVHPAACQVCKTCSNKLTGLYGIHQCQYLISYQYGHSPLHFLSEQRFVSQIHAQLIFTRYRSAYSTLYLIDVRLLVLEVYYSWYNLKQNMSKVCNVQNYRQSGMIISLLYGFIPIVNLKTLNNQVWSSNTTKRPILFFSRKFANSPSPALGFYWLYKKLPANRSDFTFALS